MRAVVHDRYGPPEVLHLEEVERPVPIENQVLVRVHATTITRTDCGFRQADPFFLRLGLGLTRPKRRILGMEFAGVVEATGPAVTHLALGDRVFGLTRHGAHAKYLCVRESGPIAHIPAGLTFEEAAALADGACLALASFRAANLQAGQRLLLYGASGAVGTAAVQLAVHAGAEVTAVCGPTSLDLVRSLGAHHVVDYTREDFAALPESRDAYDVIVDSWGHLPVLRSRRALRPGGVFVATDAAHLWQLPFLLLFTRWVGRKPLRLAIVRHSRDNVLHLRDLAAAGHFRPVVDRVYPLDQVVEATRYVETGMKTGNVVLALEQNPAG